MKPARLDRRTTWVGLLAAVASLVACGGQDDPPLPPTSAVPAVAAGAATAFANGDIARAATVFSAADGRAFVVLSDDGDAAASALHVAQGTQGRRVPAAAAFVTVTFDRSQPLAVLPLTASGVAGTYRARVADQVAVFTVAADGRVAPAAGSGCAISGRLDAARAVGGAIELALTLTGCGEMPAGDYRGIAWSGVDVAPAAWQAVLENGTRVLDLLAYR